MDYWISLTLNGVSFGMILFLISSGLTLTLGTMRRLNLTHGSFFMVGAYVAYQLQASGIDIFISWMAAAGAVAILGVAVFYLLTLVGENELRQVLLTFGLLFIIADIALVLFGGAPLILAKPAILEGTTDLGFVRYPSFKILLIFVGIAMAVGIWYFQQRTRAGMKLRAVVDDVEMAQAVGINPRRLALVTFAGGAALAGLSGALGGAVLGTFPGVDLEMLLFALVVVIVGGLGSVAGAFVGSLLIGLINNYVIALVPQLAFFSMFIVMLLVLMLRPNGILSRRAS